MDNKVEKQKQKKSKSKFQWFLFAFVIPLLFCVMILLIVATVSGVNVFEKAKEYGSKIPYISSMVAGNESKKASPKQSEDTIIKLEADIQNKNTQMSRLKKQLEKQDRDKEKLILEKKQLEEEMEELRNEQDPNKRAYKDIIKTYEAMTAKKAAPIIISMEEAEAVKILSQLNTETLAKIMEKMPPDKAAKFTELLSVNTSN